MKKSFSKNYRACDCLITTEAGKSKASSWDAKQFDYVRVIE
jgi:hypothetical protein